MPRITAEHAAAHAVLEADDRWQGMLDSTRLQVHLARFHGKTEADIENEGTVPLLMQHDYAHGAKAVRTPLPNTVERTRQKIIANGQPAPVQDKWWPWPTPAAKSVTDEEQM